ncbi:cupin domain-containing protein [Arenibacterium sp. LLYu02]|uniref:cupin domain-containing protein n=1 Tax=Arenibacterium sp. LLYu02 TaxID=3404132 RepID=UPI003B21E730
MHQSREQDEGGAARYHSETLAQTESLKVYLHSFEGQQRVPWHWHSGVSDLFICIEGCGQISLRAPEETVVLQVGERYEVAPMRPHSVSSADGKTCRMILIQGVGEIDFKTD